MSLRRDERLFLGMYQFGMNVFLPPGLLALSPILLFKRKRRTTLFPRLGFQRFPEAVSSKGGTAQGNEKVLWIHALSVGEVLSAVPLIRELHSRIKPAKLYLSVSTLSGYETAEAKLKGSLDGLFYFPLDLLFAVRRCVANVQPSMFVLVETDIWPGFMAELRRRGHTLVFGQRTLVPFFFQEIWSGEEAFLSGAEHLLARLSPIVLRCRILQKTGSEPGKIGRPRQSEV